MTVEDPTIIDLVTTSADGTHYTLVMVEQRPLEMSDEQVQQITTKINLYIEMIRSGEFFHRFPQAQGKQLGVRLLCVDEPDHPRMRELLAAAAETFMKNELEFVIEVFPQEFIEGRS